MPSFRLQTTYQDSKPLTVDRKAGVLRGITAMQAGIEALGHGIQADMTTLTTLALLGNAEADGIRSRFGHPGISENATGKKVANASNFRVQSDRLIHDSRLLDAARKSPVFAQDPVEYILDMAEKTPKELGESVVIEATTVWPLDDGRELPVEVWGPGRYYYPDGDPWDVEMKDGRPVNATTPLPVLRPIQFHFVDFVGEPALVRDGLTPMSADAINYLFGGRASEYAQEMFRIVDEWRSRYHIPLQAIPGKVDQLLSEYMAARSGKEVNMARKLVRLQEAEVEPVAQAEPVEAESAADPVDDDLSAAEQTADETAGELGDTEQMSSDIAHLQAKITSLEEQVKRLSALARQQAEMTQVLQRNLKRLNGEPVVTQKVSKSAQPALEDLAFEHPAPHYQMEAPTHVSQRRGGNAAPTGNKWADGARRQMQRSRTDRRAVGG